jgi:3-oxoadipate CoA-transferase alpha subunit
MSASFISAAEAVSHVTDGSTVALSGFGLAGQPLHLIDALCDSGASNLTIIANNAGNGETGLARLLGNKQVAKILCSFPRQQDSQIFDELYRSGKIELELVPQGTLAERIRAQGAGIGAFYTPTGVGTQIATGKEVRTINGVDQVLEFATQIDVALVHGHIADQQGNVIYRKTARNFGPIMASAARYSVVEVSRVVPIGELDPENIVTPSIFVNAIVEYAVKHAN